jgi:hypothetical protein
MLKHAGMLEPQPSMIPTLNGATNPELQWRSWIHREHQNRLVYNWVMVDQELSLFYDTAPMLAISDLQCPLPSPEALWMARNAEQWMANVQSIYGCTANVNPQLLNSQSLTPSLCDLFQDFLHDNLSRRQSSLTPSQLRLLLHPLQSLLCHLRQMLSCFSDLMSTRRATSRTVTKAGTMLRLEEVQALLQKWYELSMSLYKADPNCPITRSNLVLYHLISLNAVTNFPEIERLARREGFDGSYWELSLRHKRCVYNREEAVFHCGQVMRLLRSMAPDRRPSWWPAAIYRATLILWTDSIARLDPNFQKQQQPTPQPPSQPAQLQQASPVPATQPSPAASPGDKMAESMPTPAPTTATTPGAPRMGSGGNAVAVDRVTPEDPAVIAYLWSGDGVAVLTRRDGSRVGLDKPADVLSYGIMAVDEGVSTRIGDGVKRKLLALGSNWNVDGLSIGSV